MTVRRDRLRKLKKANGSFRPERVLEWFKPTVKRRTKILLQDVPV